MLTAPLLVLYPDGAPKAQFLSPDQRARAESEWSRLTAMPPAPEYLTAQTVAWVNSHSGDPRAAEALHLAVRAARYGCGAKAGASKDGVPNAAQPVSGFRMGAEDEVLVLSGCDWQR